MRTSARGSGISRVSASILLEAVRQSEKHDAQGRDGLGPSGRATGASGSLARTPGAVSGVERLNRVSLGRVSASQLRESLRGEGGDTPGRSAQERARSTIKRASMGANSATNSAGGGQGGGGRQRPARGRSQLGPAAFGAGTAAEAGTETETETEGSRKEDGAQIPMDLLMEKLGHAKPKDGADGGGARGGGATG